MKQASESREKLNRLRPVRRASVAASDKVDKLKVEWTKV